MSLVERPHTLLEKDMSRNTSPSDMEKSSSTERTCDSYSTKSSAYDEPILDDFVEMDETTLIEQATVQVAEKKAMDIDTPELPRKSSLRASRLLTDLKINTVTPNQSLLNAPHDLYLSSEEDASSSAGDSSDYDVDSSSEVSPASPTGQESHEDTARVVSVIFSGKPCIVNLTGSNKRAGSPLSDKSSRPQTSADADIFDESAQGPSSRCTSRNSSFYSVNSAPRSRRSSTTFFRRSSFYSTDSAASRGPAPSFLSVDPFASDDYSLSGKDVPSETTAPRTPRTPTAIFNRVSHTLSLSRKRSRPTLHDSNSDRASGSRESFFSLRTASTLPVLPEPCQSVCEKSSEPTEVTVTRQSTPRRYSTAWKKMVPMGNSHSQPMSPLSPAGTAKKALLGSLHLSKRKSLRL